MYTTPFILDTIFVHTYLYLFEIMMIKLYVLLFQVKGWDNSIGEESMSTPLVRSILLGVILLVVLLRVISRLHDRYLMQKNQKYILDEKIVKKDDELPALCIFGLRIGCNAEEMSRTAVWIYDVQLNSFDSLYNNALSKGGMSYEEGLSLVHPDDRNVYEENLSDLTCGAIERITVLVRFYHNGKYELYRINAVALKSHLTGEVDKIIGTEENLSREIGKIS